MVSCALFACIYISLMLNYSAQADEDYDYVVSTMYGKVRGYRIQVTEKYVDQYLGIPYATPPVDELRFKPTTPHQPWKGTLNGTRYGKGCMQLPDTQFGDFEGTNMWNPNVLLDEDCLYLNVWTPHPRPTNAAVMVWIYGGGFVAGVASLEVYHGATLAATEGTIVVSFNYRVASLGFFYLGHEDAPGNIGLLDQVLALQWVQDNIIHFGGDPTRVTIFGESAGSVSVGLHLLSPVSRNLFARAILQSGTPNNPWATVTADEARRRSLKLSKELGCYNEHSMTNNEDIALCMRRQDARDLISSEWFDDMHGIYRFPFIPVVDGTFLTETPQSSLERHAFKPTSVMLGTNKDEGPFFIIYYVPEFRYDNESLIDRSVYKKAIDIGFKHLNKFGRDAVAFRYINWWDTNEGAMLRDGFSNMIGDENIHCPAQEFAYSYATGQEDVYLYYFTQRASNSLFHPWMGVLHGDEIAYVFGLPLHEQGNYSTGDIAVSRHVMRSWANFAKTGNPNKSSLDEVVEEKWQKYTPSEKHNFVISAATLPDGEPNSRGSRLDYCAFWREYIPNLVTTTADIKEEEQKWKEEFHRWSTKYMVDWKAEFNHYVTNRGQGCDADVNE
ncbi:acetylcholinesterase-like precursor [Saccoglossus kowalevskii]|uniref:Carboxylic ester hydrolase n=1 Tax=Saccoglossus kowalevskii TaxID=10224 RepID=A0A0A7DYB7_SACKO|nr:acetylcholinesterase-like precursor [Saccoglossus kowalevskii]AIY55351.1 acetylcholinesterase [Saccoglossus kowalevskii]AOR07018.1 acetylcholinesterase-like protein [Saccoglossus kowalevskii]